MGENGTQAAYQPPISGELTQVMAGVLEGGETFGPAGFCVRPLRRFGVHQAPHGAYCLVASGSRGRRDGWAKGAELPDSERELARHLMRFAA